ncbi:MAG: ATP-binding protein [Bacillota bacterium]
MILRGLYLNKIEPFIDKDLIKVIVGIRRSGKSTLMRQIIDMLKNKGIKTSQIIYLNFEDYRIREYKETKVLYDYIENHLYQEGRTYIFLDEVQEVNEFEKVVNSFHAMYDVDIYLTGSNSKMISGEYASLLTGRYKSFEIFPFSFKEFVEFHSNNNIEIESLFNNYIKYGGFPIIQNFDNHEEKLSLLRDLYDSVVINDILQRHEIRNIHAFDQYISYILNTVSSQFSAKNISNYFKKDGRSLSKETLYNYIYYLKEVLLIYSAKRYDLKGKKLLTTNEKYFVNDQGLRAIKFDNIKDIEKILENIIFFELLRRGYEITVGMIKDKEIDFIVSLNNKIEYYQVSYLMETEKTREREFNSLIQINDQYPKYVLSLDKVDFSQQGVTHINIIDFLLQE